MHQLQSLQEKLISTPAFVITTITWNLHGKLPQTKNLTDLVNSSNFNPPPHLIFFGTQECQRELRTSFCCENKQAWEAMLIEAFSEYDLVRGQSMIGLHSAVLVLRKYKKQLKIYGIRKLRAGAGGWVGTKGALSITMTFMGAPLQFINCHLASGQHQSLRRNATISQILEELVEKQEICQVIWMGDFNYRINMTRSQFDKLLSEDKTCGGDRLRLSKLLAQEQMRTQKDIEAHFFEKFQEGEIEFPPTYKLGEGHVRYDHTRIPGWTDRIFSRKSKELIPVSYDCLEEVLGSDHRPVLARYTKSLGGIVSEQIYFQKEENCQLI